LKNSDGIKILIAASLALMILAGTGAAVCLSNSGGGTWKYYRHKINKDNSMIGEKKYEK
jgi:hypothetical protein